MAPFAHRPISSSTRALYIAIVSAAVLVLVLDVLWVAQANRIVTVHCERFNFTTVTCTETEHVNGQPVASTTVSNVTTVGRPRVGNRNALGEVFLGTENGDRTFITTSFVGGSQLQEIADRVGGFLTSPSRSIDVTTAPSMGDFAAQAIVALAAFIVIGFLIVPILRK